MFKGNGVWSRSFQKGNNENSLGGLRFFRETVSGLCLFKKGVMEIA